MDSYTNSKYRVNIIISTSMMVSEVAPPMLFNTAKPCDRMSRWHGYDS